MGCSFLDAVVLEWHLGGQFEHQLGNSHWLHQHVHYSLAPSKPWNKWHLLVVVFGDHVRQSYDLDSIYPRVIKYLENVAKFAVEVRN